MAARGQELREALDEHTDERDEDALQYERTGTVVIVLPPSGQPECEGEGWYE